MDEDDSEKGEALDKERNLMSLELPTVQDLLGGIDSLKKSVNTLGIYSRELNRINYNFEKFLARDTRRTEQAIPNYLTDDTEWQFLVGGNSWSCWMCLDEISYHSDVDFTKCLHGHTCERCGTCDTCSSLEERR